MNKKVISVKIRDHKYFPPDSTPVLIAPIEKSLDGKIYELAHSGQAILINKLGRSGNKDRVLVQFLQTGFKKEAQLFDLNRGLVKDPYYPSRVNVGYVGNGSRKRDSRLYDTWGKMIERCYDPTHQNYHIYGGAGVTVYRPWWNFEIFAEEGKLLPGWAYVEEDPSKFQLDKDYYNARYYGPDSCVWSDKRSNIAYALCKAFSAHKNGEYIDTYLAIRDAVDATGIDRTSIRNCLHNKKPSVKGFNFNYLPEIPGCVYRYELD